MAIAKKHVPLKETIGLQYVCFDIDSADGEWTGNFETDVICIDGVKSSEVTDNSESTDVYASGKLHDTVRGKGSYDIGLTTLGFDAETLAKMRGDSVDETTGLVRKGTGKRPYFAYGRVVEYVGGGVRWDWYPKCKLVENTDSGDTSEESYSEQTDDMTIRAYEYDSAKNIAASVDSNIKLPDGLTEETFFAQVVMSPTDLPTA